MELASLSQEQLLEKRIKGVIVLMVGSTFQYSACADPEGGGGAGGLGPPLKNHKNIGSPSNTGPDPFKITKLPSQHSMFGHHRHAEQNAILMAFRWWADDGPILVVFGSTHLLKKKKVAPPLKKLSGSAHVQ